MSDERIQKLISQAGVASRRKAEELIRQGRVTVNGRLAVLGQKADPGRDVIKVEGRKLRPPSTHHRYLLMNKPTGCVSTVSDPQGRPTVLDLVPVRLRRGLVPVGRLDYHSEGLLLLSDDGEFAHRVAHPRYGCKKVYLAKVRGLPGEKQLDRLRNGILLEGKRTAPCEIRPHRMEKGARTAKKNSWWEVQLVEGRNRQIREMFSSIGHPLQRLRRVAIGSLADTALPAGGWRELLDTEVKRLMAGGKKGKDSKKKGKRREKEQGRKSRSGQSKRERPRGSNQGEMKARSQGGAEKKRAAKGKGKRSPR